jgi:hypothetical protein
MFFNIKVQSDTSGEKLPPYLRLPGCAYFLERMISTKESLFTSIWWNFAGIEA